MKFRFQSRTRFRSTHPAVSVRLALDTLEDRLPPGSMASVGLPAILGLNVASFDPSPAVPEVARAAELPATPAPALTLGAGLLPAATDTTQAASRVVSANRDDNPPSVPSATVSLADPSSIEGPGSATAIGGSLDRSPSEAALSAVARPQAPLNEGTPHAVASGGVVNVAAAPDAGRPRPAASTAPSPGNAGHPGDQLANQVVAASLDQSQGSGKHDPSLDGGGEFFTPGNVRANSRTTCSGGQGTLQSETAIAVSGNAVVVGYNDFRGFYCAQNGYQVTGWSYSLDYGQTFTDGGPLPGRQALGGDPELATGPDGTIYLVSLYNPLSAMAVLRGTVTDTGISWSNPVVISGDGFDKENIAIDQNSGEIYLTYTRFGGTPGIGLFTSTDGGLSFQGPFAVTHQSGVQGSAPAIGPNGELYVAYNIGYPSDTGIGFVASYDGGHSFTAERQIGATRAFSIPGTDRAPAFPHLAVDTSASSPWIGNLYVTWQTAGVTGNGEAVISRSQDGGATWDAPRVLNNDGSTTGIEWYPTVTVDPYGNVDTFFYSRRDHPGTTLTDLYYVVSGDGGDNYLPAFRVTDTSSNWHQSNDGTPTWGDYINATNDGFDSLVAYADGRDGDPDAYFARVSFLY